jgi:hypothetical protein
MRGIIEYTYRHPNMAVSGVRRGRDRDVKGKGSDQ